MINALLIHPSRQAIVYISKDVPSISIALSPQTLQQSSIGVQEHFLLFNLSDLECFKLKLLLHTSFPVRNHEDIHLFHCHLGPHDPRLQHAVPPETSKLLHRPNSHESWRRRRYCQHQPMVSKLMGQGQLSIAGVLRCASPGDEDRSQNPRNNYLTAQNVSMWPRWPLSLFPQYLKQLLTLLPFCL